MYRNCHNIAFPLLPALLAGTLLLSSCQSDSDLEPMDTMPLQLSSLGNTMRQDFDGITRFATRAPGDPSPGSFVPGTLEGGDRPEGIPSFLPYNSLYPLPLNKDYTTIGCFLADDKHTSYNTLSGYFSWKDENKWDTTVGIKPGQFFIFGYMPSNASGGTPSIARLDKASSWADGCRMIIPELSTVTPADVCVVVGVLKGSASQDPITTPSIVQDIKQGEYSYQGTAENNYVYLLLDHLYTNVNLELSVEPGYAALRTIKLKKVLMQSNANSTVDVKVTLVNDQKNPIREVTYTESATHSTINVAIFSAGTGEAREISSDAAHPTSIPGYFAPGQTTQSFSFEFVYDVYDRQGNLVRKDCHAVNRWTLPGSSVTSGLSFRVKATIRPTYLYQLSEPDLDNPSIELSTNG